MMDDDGRWRLLVDLVSHHPQTSRESLLVLADVLRDIASEGGASELASLASRARGDAMLARWANPPPDGDALSDDDEAGECHMQG